MHSVMHLKKKKLFFSKCITFIINYGGLNKVMTYLQKVVILEELACQFLYKILIFSVFATIFV